MSLLIRNYLNENTWNRLYIIDVEKMKCFDSVYKNAFWLNMCKNGIQGKILRILRDMYQKVKSCVKPCPLYSDYFDYASGLRQGEVMSPVFFSLFVEKLELYLQNDINSGISLDDIRSIILLFADGVAIKHTNVTWRNSESPK